MAVTTLKERISAVLNLEEPDPKTYFVAEVFFYLFKANSSSCL